MVSSLSYKEVTSTATAALRHSPSILVREDWSYDIHFSSVRITTTSLAAPQEDVAYSANITAIGGSESGYAWTVVYGTVPPGLSLAGSGTPTTTLSGTPTTAGTYTFTVRVTDDGGNVDDQAYTLTVAASPVTPALVIRPLTDTIRGGARVLVGGNFDLRDTSRDETLTERALPSGWVVNVVGDGAAEAVAGSGAALDSGVTAGGEAALTSPATWGLAHVRVDVVPKSPAAVGDDEEVEVGALELFSGADAARVRLLRRGARLLAEGQAFRGGLDRATPGSRVALAWAPGDAVRLSLLRRAGRLLGSVLLLPRGEDPPEEVALAGERVLDAYTWLTGDVSLQLAVRNDAYAGRALSLFRNFVVTPFVLVDGQPLDRMTVSSRRVAGFVPATSLARRGARELMVGGLFGEEVSPNAFVYTLPSPRTLGRQRLPGGGDSGDARTALVVVQDPALVDVTPPAGDEG